MAEVWVDGERVSAAAAGETMTGFPATTDMRFRIGSVAIPYLTTSLLKLVDEGEVALDDKISRWRPDLPHADEITLKMLASTSSGYADYVTDRTFIADLYKNPFRTWTAEERVKISVSKPLVLPPGSGFAYSHANWVILGDIISRVRHKPLHEVMVQDVLGPLGLSHTAISSKADIPEPVLHSFDNERGVFEDATYWNPSWTLAPGAVMTGTLEDMAKSFAAIGDGKLLTPESHKAQLTGVVKVKGDTWFALGLPVQNTWIVQNPSFAGLRGHGRLPAVQEARHRDGGDAGPRQHRPERELQRAAGDRRAPGPGTAPHSGMTVRRPLGRRSRRGRSRRAADDASFRPGGPGASPRCCR